MLTGIHTLCSAIGCYCSVYIFNTFKPAHLGRRENLVMVAFSFLYTINIVPEGSESALWGLNNIIVGCFKHISQHGHCAIPPGCASYNPCLYYHA